jgi:serine/threonine protein kinase
MSFDPLHDPTIPSQAPRYYQGRKMFGGRYTLTKRLGSGGMGVVWLAQDNELGIQRALKFAPPEVAADARSVAMLKREATAGTSLAHPHIVRIFDFAHDVHASKSAVVMEVVEGKSLADLQAERIEATGNGYFEPEEIEPWLQQAAAALDYAHAEGRAHRDLKPQNFMIETATGRLKIMDFGISRRIGDSHATLTGKDSSGTLPYMSPQQVLGDAPTSSDDIYGMGATLYDLLTGSPPFIGGDIPSQVREKPPTPLNQRRAEVNAEAGKPIPAAWEQAVLACLSKKREDRPSSAGAAHQFISQCQANQAKAAAVAERARRAVEVHATQAEKRCHEELVAAWKRPRAAPERVVPDFSPPQPGASKAPLLAQRLSQSQCPPKVAQVFNLWAPSLRA